MAHGRKRMFALGGTLGALAAYWLDRDSGRGRRARARDRAAGMMRRGGREAGRKIRYGLSTVEGQAQRMAFERRHPIQLDDVTLAAKVKSELFSPNDVPKGKISVDVTGGVVTLRGQLSDGDMITRLERAARKINGVRDVVCLLHLPGEPVPTASRAY